MDSTIEDIRNSDITSGKKFDYMTKQGSNIEIPKGSKEAHNIYFYIADVWKVKRVSGIQFVTDRYMKASKGILHRSKSSEGFQQHQSSHEDSKNPDESESNDQLQKLKFEKYILLLLLGCCDLSGSWFIKSSQADDYKEIINMIKINKINELKRLGKNSINFEILSDMVKEPGDIGEFIQRCLPELKKETEEILESQDKQISDLLKGSEQQHLQIEILKTDIENIDFIKWNEMRMNFLKNVKIPVCLQYFTDAIGFKIVDTKDCGECKKAKQTSFGPSAKLKNISSQDIFFKGIPKVMEEATEAEEEAKKKENEMKNFVHKSFVYVNEFMEEFFNLPIFKFTGKEPMKELKLISERYKDYLERIKQKIFENQTLK